MTFILQGCDFCRTPWTPTRPERRCAHSAASLGRTYRYISVSRHSGALVWAFLINFPMWTPSTPQQDDCHPGKLLRCAWQKGSVTVWRFRVCLEVCHTADQWMAAPGWSCRLTGRLNHLPYSVSSSREGTPLLCTSMPAAPLRRCRRVS